MGKPIIAYSIEKAIQSNLFDEVMVSTDDKEIAEIAKSYGAEVPFLRSISNASDTATTLEVIIEVLKAYENRGVLYDIGCCIYPTAPLMKIEKLKEGMELLMEKDFVSVFPVLPFSYPIWRSLKYDQLDGKVAMNWPENQNSRSQDLPVGYHDAGQFYWFNTKGLLDCGRLFTDNSGAIVLDEMEAQDIDNEVDWRIAELKAKLM